MDKRGKRRGKMEKRGERRGKDRREADKHGKMREKTAMMSFRLIPWMRPLLTRCSCTNSLIQAPLAQVKELVLK